MYAWKHSIQPFAYCSCPATQFSGLASQKCMWVSTTKYFSPFFSYICFLLSSVCPARFDRLALGGGPRRQIESEEVRRVFGIGEHDRPVVLVDHAAVVGRHVLLELVGVECALLAEGFVNLGVDDVHTIRRIDSDHRGEVHHGDVRLGLHHLCDNGPHLVVHQGESAPVRCGVVGLEWARDRCFQVGGHRVNSFGSPRPSWDSMPLNRDLALSRPPSKRGGLHSGWDHSGWSVRAAEMARGTQAWSHWSRRALLWSANSRSFVSSANMGMV